MIVTALPDQANAICAKATVAEDGSLRLENPAPTLKPGEKVMLTISPIVEPTQNNPRPLLGTVIHYDDPFGPATAPDEWEAAL